LERVGGGMLAKILFYLRNKVIVDKENSLDVKDGSQIKNCKVKIRGKNNRLKIEKNVILRGVNIEMRGIDCSIVIGENSIIGNNIYISAREKNTKIQIGKNCMLSRNIKIMTSDGHDILEEQKRINRAKDIVLEDHVWLSDNVTLLKGSYIGEGSVVAINSTVTKKFREKNVIIAGNPAKVIKQNIQWEKELTF
jgi:acetyltransferase-like isoleucine patch superfamily enzyme